MIEQNYHKEECLFFQKNQWKSSKMSRNLDLYLQKKSQGKLW